MQRKLNWRLAIVLTVAGVLLVSGIYGLHRIQIGRSKDLFLRNAEEAEEAEEYAKAVESYGLYLRLEPSDAEVRSQLGRLYAKLGDHAAASSALEQTLRINPNDRESRKALVPVAIAMSRFTDAETHLRLLLDLTKGEEPAAEGRDIGDAELFDLLGQSQSLAFQFQEAAKSYVVALRIDPELFVAYGRLTQLLHHRLERPLAVADFEALVSSEPGQEQILDSKMQADRIMQGVVDRHPDVAQAHYQRGRYLRGVASTESGDRFAELGRQAASEAEEAVRLDPDDADIRILAAQCALQQADRERAHEHAEHGIGLMPEAFQWYSFLALSADLADPDKAISWLRLGIERASDKQDELLIMLSNALLELGRIDEAIEAVTDLRAFDERKSWARFFEAKIEFAKENWTVATGAFESVRPDFRERPEILGEIDVMLGRCYAKLGNREKQLEFFRRVSRGNPDLIEARLDLVSALVASNKSEEATNELFAIAQIELTGEGVVPAKVFYDLTRLTIRRSLQSAGRWAEAEKWLAAAAKKAPNSPLIPIFQAEISVGRGNPDVAAEILAKARAANPEQLAYRIGQANLAAWKQNWDDARSILNEAKQDFDDSVELRLATARVLYHQFQGTPTTDALFDLAAANDSFSPAESAKLWRELAKYAVAMRELDLASDLLGRLVAEQPDDLNNWLLRFDLSVRQDDSAGLREALAAIDRIEGHGPMWHYGQALYLQMESADDDQVALKTALEHLRQATAAYPGPSALLTAQIHQQMGEPDLAIGKYIEAIDLGVGNATVVRQVVQLLSQRQRLREADEVIKNFERRQQPFTPEAAELGRMARQISFQLEDYDRALSVARRTSEGSENYLDHVWLGQLAATRGLMPENPDPELVAQAEQEFRRATELAEDVPEPWIALVVLLGRLDREDDVAEALRETQQKVPTERLPITLAQCYEGLGRFEEAEAKYVEAAERSPIDVGAVRATAAFYRRMESQLGRGDHDDTKSAEGYLIRLKDDPQVDLSEKSWARHQLAQIELRRGGPDHVTNADKLLIENLAASPDSMPDQRLRALVLLARGSVSDRAEAFKSLDALGDQASPFERFSLAQLQDQQGQWPEASRRMQQVISGTEGRREQPQYVAWYASALLRHDELSEVDRWIDKLDTLDGAGEAAKYLRAEVLARRGLHDQAQKLLLALVTQAEESADGLDLKQRSRVAGRLEALARGRDDEPEVAAEYQRAAEKLLETDDLVHAQFLAKRGKHDEALGKVESAFDDEDPQRCLPALVVILESPKATTGQLERVQRILSDVMEGQEPSITLLAVQARLSSVQRKFEQAESVYRQMLELEPRSYVALNNLAMLLVGQSKQLPEALDCVERAIEIVGPIPQLLDSQALVVLAQQHPKHAVLLLERALIDAQSAEFFFHLAAAYHRLGQVADAKVAMTRANELGLQIHQLTDYELQLHDDLAGLLN